MNKTTFKKLSFFAAAVFLGYTGMKGQAITENFDDITLLAGSGWATQNNSAPVGVTGWSQGPDVANGGPFDSYNGATISFISANFNNTGSTGTISNWLITPNRTFRNGDVITFYTRKPAGSTDYPDRLEVRLSTNGASTNVGTGATAVGDFTTLLLSINPSLTTGVYPTTWTMYTITISGLSAPTSGRAAFRYFVTGAGSLGSNSDFIGIDAFNYIPYVCPVFTMTAGGALTGGVAGSAYSTTLTQTGALGAPNFAITAGALPPGLTLSSSGTISGTPTATGTFNFTATVSDNSGCSGSQAYSITVVCGSNPITMNIPAVCENAGITALTGALPAGGTYSGTGVTGGDFDPVAGTQTITYDYTDAFGCSYSSNSTITVNTVPVVTLGALSAVCVNGSDVTLSGGTPSGGTYSGVNVSGGIFSPIAVGTTDVIYTYTDANGCTEDDTVSMVVNDLPVVALTTIADVCLGSTVTLSNGTPSGGTYSGADVTAGDLTPAAAGTTDVIYTYTDANGCTEDDTVTVNVNALPVVTQSTVSDMCQGATVTLTGGAPAGGVYSGTDVNGGDLTPSAAGTTDVIYTYTDANGCSEDDTVTVNVNPLPAVSLGTLSNVCVNSGSFALSGGAPAGGSYSGANITAGSFDPTVAGTFNVTYTYTDANGCIDSASQTITVDPCVGLTENIAVSGVKYYPNPTTGLFTLELVLNEMTDLNVSIIDIQGKVIVKDTRASLTGTYSKSFDLSNFAKGVYTMEINSGKATSYYKIVVQ